MDSAGVGMLLNLPLAFLPALLQQNSQFLGEQALFSPGLGKVKLQHLHTMSVQDSQDRTYMNIHLYSLPTATYIFPHWSEDSNLQKVWVYILFTLFPHH